MAEIREVQARTGRALGQGAGPYHMMIWGAVWFLGYLRSQFLDFETAGMVWTALVIPGMIASALVEGVSLRFRRAAYEARLRLFWLALLAYAALIISLSGIAEKPVLMSYVIALFAMFGYVVMGLALDAVGLDRAERHRDRDDRLSPRSGLFLSDNGAPGGGKLFLSGFYISRAWR